MEMFSITEEFGRGCVGGNFKVTSDHQQIIAKEEWDLFNLIPGGIEGIFFILANAIIRNILKNIYYYCIHS